MLLVYLEPFREQQLQLLASWSKCVTYWPRSFAHTTVYNAAVPSDYWLLFHKRHQELALQWLMLYSEHSRIVHRLDGDLEPF